MKSTIPSVGLSPLHKQQTLSSFDVRSQHTTRDQKAALDQILGFLEGSVFVLDADDVIVTHAVQRACNGDWLSKFYSFASGDTHHTCITYSRLEIISLDTQNS